MSALKIDVLTLFPQVFEAVSKYGITSRALNEGLFNLHLWDLREFSDNNYRSVDDRPYGGGPGMVMMAEPLARALQAARERQKAAGVEESKVIYLSPQGQRFTHPMGQALLKEAGLIMIAGRYEGVDERLLEREVDHEISIGDYVLSGGELPAMVIIDSLVRQLPGVLGHPDSAVQDSFVDGLLDYPHYTRPEVYDDREVPAVLKSGNHAAILRWRLKQALGRTALRRADLLSARGLSQEELALLEEFKQEHKEAFSTKE